MTPDARTDYIVACIREAGSMYPDDAKAFLADHDADVLKQAQSLLTRAINHQPGQHKEHHGGIGYALGVLQALIEHLTGQPDPTPAADGDRIQESADKLRHLPGGGR